MARPQISTAKRVSYALGYIELGLTELAAAELEAVEGEDAKSLPVRLARLELHLAAGNWERLVEVAKAVAQADPSQERAWIGWAYGLRSLEQVSDARGVLRVGEQYHGKRCALLHYNLACYECLLGDQTAAKVRLRQARKLGGKHFKAMALEDTDLKAMWDEIAAMT